MSEIYQNHLVDPTFFFDCVEEFAFNYTLYRVSDKVIDEYGRTSLRYSNETIRGSLQSQGLSLNQSKSGNTNVKSYKFYCMSLYRISEEDIIKYKNNFYMVTDVHDYDEWGVRECSLIMIQLTAYRDLNDYVNYLNGSILT